MNKKYHVVCGLPRSGSTLLCNVLNQNPAFYASTTSGLSRLLFSIRQGYDSIAEHKATFNLERKRNVLKSVVDGYYSHIKKAKVIFDRNRGWNDEVYLAKEVFGEEIKFIACVRDVNEIIASFEKLYRKQDGYNAIQDKVSFPEAFRTLQGRIKVWTSTNGPIGSTYLALKEMHYKTENILFVPFDELTKHPESVLKGVYDFIEEEYYKDHDFSNVESGLEEDDQYHGMLHLHETRNKIEHVKHYASTILPPDVLKANAGAEFWK